MKLKDMDKETKGFLNILIREIQDILNKPRLRKSQIKKEIVELLGSWIKANDLHPERVQTLGQFTSLATWRTFDFRLRNTTSTPYLWVSCTHHES